MPVLPSLPYGLLTRLQALTGAATLYVKAKLYASTPVLHTIAGPRHA